MKTIMVFDVPASMGGALTILKSFYEYAAKRNDINWIFVVSVDELDELDNVQVLSYRWIKKSWIHRLFFDSICAPILVKKYSPNAILSLQNVCIKVKRIKQILYVHQPIPFTKINYRLSDNIVLWIYQKVIGKLIFQSVRRADGVIVQTEWMKNAVLDKTRIDIEKIHVIPPEYSITTSYTYNDSAYSRKRFFYPVAPNPYKNHKVLLNAAKLLNTNGISDFSIILTCDEMDILDGVNTKDISQLLFVGRLSQDEVYRTLSNSTLVFSSKLETFGLPMLEAACIKSRVIAGDMPFSHDILDGYPNVSFFNVDDSEQLAEIMKQIILNSREYVVPKDNWHSLKDSISGWDSLVDLF